MRKITVLLKCNSDIAHRRAGERVSTVTAKSKKAEYDYRQMPGNHTQLFFRFFCLFCRERDVVVLTYCALHIIIFVALKETALH